MRPVAGYGHGNVKYLCLPWHWTKAQAQGMALERVRGVRSPRAKWLELVRAIVRIKWDKWWFMGLFATKRRPQPQWYIVMFPLKRVNYYLIYRDTVFSDKSKEVRAGAFASNLEGNPLVSFGAVLIVRVGARVFPLPGSSQNFLAAL